MEKTVFCPVKNGQANGTECLEICIVADREAKPTILPEGIAWDEEQRQLCLNCKYHADLSCDDY